MKLKKIGVIFSIFLITITIPIVGYENLDKTESILNIYSNNGKFLSIYQLIILTSLKIQSSGKEMSLKIMLW